RYRLLEPIRQYAEERLLASGEAEATRRRHAEHCLALVERAEPKLRGPEQQRWFARLARELDNLRAALAWSRTPDGDTELGLGLHRARVGDRLPGQLPRGECALPGGDRPVPRPGRSLGRGDGAA